MWDQKERKFVVNSRFYSDDTVCECLRHSHYFSICVKSNERTWTCKVFLNLRFFVSDILTGHIISLGPTFFSCIFWKRPEETVCCLFLLTIQGKSFPKCSVVSNQCNLTWKLLLHLSIFFAPTASPLYCVVWRNWSPDKRYGSCPHWS